MKKILSLVLAAALTVSLLAVGAGAAEYKDLTDKSDIRYEEAVTLLNKLGVITGYADGSFNPAGTLTRGAAAKILAFLTLGPDAAAQLTAPEAPYKDVPADNTYAPVIGHCKTNGYISGYSDGTFHPNDTVTGYAFAKMLLGILGYDGKIEGFVGTGWTMNVARMGNTVGLFSDVDGAFPGNQSITREEACLLALNTLKATEVQYNRTNVTAGDVTISTGDVFYVTSTDQSINRNISSQRDGGGAYYLEFGEEHFPQLKLTAGTDAFQRPSRTWTWKGEAVGTFALSADFTFTEAVSGETAAEKIAAMGIGSCTVSAASYYVDGKAQSLTGDNQKKLETLAGLPAEGKRVELYLDVDNAELICAVIVTAEANGRA